MKGKLKQKGFTLVELLVVIAIMAVVMGISVAGIGYAMRRSRNIAKQSAISNLERGLQAYYADNNKYPEPTSIQDLVEGGGSESLNQQLEGSWDAGPAGSEYYYMTSGDALYFIACTNQEEGLTGSDEYYYCKGPGMGQGGSFPDSSDNKVEDISSIAGDPNTVCGEWDGDSGWGECSGGE